MICQSSASVTRHNSTEGTHRFRAVVDFPHAPAAADVKQSRKTHSEYCREEECKKRPHENQDSSSVNQKFQFKNTE